MSWHNIYWILFVTSMRVLLMCRWVFLLVLVVVMGTCVKRHILLFKFHFPKMENVWYPSTASTQHIYTQSSGCLRNYVFFFSFRYFSYMKFQQFQKKWNQRKNWKIFSGKKKTLFFMLLYASQIQSVASLITKAHHNTLYMCLLTSQCYAFLLFNRW